jgi:hypothetical protein
MGSSLSRILPSIIMIALIDAIIKDLLDNNIIKFYIRYITDILVLAKPSDIDLILNKLNRSQIFNSHMKNSHLTLPQFFVKTLTQASTVYTFF